MQVKTVLGKGPRQNRRIAFTLIELLTVIAIIAILAALVLAAGSGVMQKAARSRAAGEIQGMSTALESYKTDNGIYPFGNTIANASSGSALVGPPGGSYSLNPVTDPNYQLSSEGLLQNLAGLTNYATDVPVAGVKSYMSFKANQIGNPAGPSYVKDPWNNSYGYSTGDNKSPQVVYPFNGSGFFDLWSTAGTTGTTPSNPNPTNSWISNWQ